MARNYAEIGVSGLIHYGGRIQEEWLRKLQGERGRRVLREMADNDATIGALLFAIEMILRNVEWRVEAFSESPEHQEEAEFVEGLLDDMSHTWQDFIAEALTMLVHGFAPHEIVYKRRDGPDQKDPSRRSKFNDGKVGWRKLPLRAQDTLDEWEMDEDGGVRGFWQLPPTVGERVFIPIEKLLIFRTTSRKNNPEGRSVLRNAYLAWYRKSRIEENEAIGIERDLAGLPIFYLPPEMFDAEAPAEVQAQLALYRQAVENLRQDEQAGLLIPSVYDEQGNQLVKFELAGTGSRRLFDTTMIVQRYDRQIAMTVLADFIFLGHEKVGSFALSSDKTELFSTALGAWLQELAAVMNRHALPRLYQLNGWNASEIAELVPGDIEKADLERFATAVANLTAAGFLTPGGEEDEEHLRNLLDMPARPEGLGEDLGGPPPGSPPPVPPGSPPPVPPGGSPPIPPMPPGAGNAADDQEE